jgi:type I restriction enzyme M protein
MSNQNDIIEASQDAMAVVDRTGVDAQSNLLFHRTPDGEKLVSDEEVIERVREGDEVEIRPTTRWIHDELRLVAEKYKEFRATGEVTL